MADDDKEPMIGKDSRPSSIDEDLPIADWRYRDLVAVIHSEIEVIKPEWHKPEHWKPEHIKPERIKPERIKPEGLKPEQLKPERFKPEKEVLKPEKELSKPPFEIEDLADQVAERVVRLLKERGGLG